MVYSLYYFVHVPVGDTIDVITDDDKILKAIYYQTDTTKNIFDAYPELLMVDATYKLTDQQMPVFLQPIQDGNGEICLRNSK